MESAPSPASEGKALNLKQDKLLRINQQPCYRMGEARHEQQRVE